MPELSRFFGIIITMYMEQAVQHNTPHFHVRYGEHKASYSFEGDILSGSLPTKQERLVLAWLELHKDELEDNWTLLSQGDSAFAIDPLKR
jgi:hypothetical protein